MYAKLDREGELKQRAFLWAPLWGSDVEFQKWVDFAATLPRGQGPRRDVQRVRRRHHGRSNRRVARAVCRRAGHARHPQLSVSGRPQCPRHPSEQGGASGRASRDRRWRRADGARRLREFEAGAWSFPHEPHRARQRRRPGGRAALRHDRRRRIGAAGLALCLSGSRLVHVREARRQRAGYHDLRVAHARQRGRDPCVR